MHGMKNLNLELRVFVCFCNRKLGVLNVWRYRLAFPWGTKLRKSWLILQVVVCIQYDCPCRSVCHGLHRYISPDVGYASILKPSVPAAWLMKCMGKQGRPKQGTNLLDTQSSALGFFATQLSLKSQFVLA
jgi:hypothetical protein